MTVGVGGSTAEAELAAIKSMRGDVPPIGVDERLRRIARAQEIMREKGIDALYLDVSSSMTYFTGLKFRRTERMHSAVLPAKGEIVYISPAFEVEKLKTMISFGDKIAVWEEDEDPTATVTETVRALGYPSGTIAVDEATPFFTFDGLRRAGNAYTFINSIDVTAGCRMIKSEHELALMQTAKNITLEAHKAAARIMREGITTTEVQAFLAAAHRKLGSEGDPPFNAVLFGEASAYPHGVPYPQTLKDGDMILIDTGAPVDRLSLRHHAFLRFGEPTRRQRDVWNLEKAAQAAGFAAAKPGNRCEDIDIAGARGHKRRRLRARLCDARPPAPHRPRHRPGRARMALSREGRQDRAAARHDLLERADHLHLWRIRRAPRGSHDDHRDRRPLVYPAGPFGRRSLRPGEVNSDRLLFARLGASLVSLTVRLQDI